MVHAAREQIDQAAANGIIAGIGHRFGANIAIGLQQLRQIVAVDPLTRRKRGYKLAQAKRRQRALGCRIDGGDEQLRPACFVLQGRKGRHAL